MVSLTVGPVPDDVSIPEVGGLRWITRRAYAGEVGRSADRPRPGFSVGAGRDLAGGPSNCDCGRVRGVADCGVVPLLRLDGGARGDVAEVLDWARVMRLPMALQLLAQEEGGADAHGGGYALVWCSTSGRPLRRRGARLVGGEALGVAVEANGTITGHVALHAVRDDGTIVVAGLWDVEADAAGRINVRWAGNAARWLASRRRIAFPAAAFRAALAKARCRACTHLHYAAGSRGRGPTFRMAHSKQAAPAVRSAEAR